MHRFAAALLCAAIAAPAGADTTASQDAAARPADAAKTAKTAGTSKPKAKTAHQPKPATAREQLKDEAQGLALASQTVEQITETQVELARQVQVGTTDCEHNQHVTIEPVTDRPGLFTVGFKSYRFMMVPEPTSSGAVRLEDKRAGVIWLQIPVKSMLMNTRAGQRMVDSCQSAEQRQAQAADEATGADRPGALLSTPAAVPTALATH